MLGKELGISLGCPLSLFLFIGCASPQKALYLDPEFEKMNIDTITILPIVDSRTQRKLEISESKLQQIVYPIIATGLNEKGYTLEYGNETAGIQCLKFGRSSNIPPIPDGFWPFFLQDFQMRTPYAGAVAAKMAGIVFDRKKGKMLWRDFGEKVSHQNWN